VFFEARAEQPVAGRITWVGRFNRLKGVHLLIQALPLVRERVPTAHLRLVGPTDNAEYLADVRRLSQATGCEERVEFVGAVNSQALPMEYAIASVVALPSLQENAPMSVMEAMAAARPVVASRVGGIPDFIADRVTGALVTPGSVQELADALAWVLVDECRRQHLGVEARSRAGKQFEPSAVAERHEAVYADMARRR
jgi:glycosyltransferase involved in cell wall biosynthesis